MIYVLIGLLIAMAVTVVLWVVFVHDDNVLVLVLAFLGSVAVLITAIVFAFAVWDYVAAEHKAQIINREYGTSYTQEEIYYAEDVIDTIREIDRTRIEANGNLFKTENN